MNRIIPAVVAAGLATAGIAFAQTSGTAGGAAGTGTSGATGAPTTMGTPNTTMGTTGSTLTAPGGAGAVTGSTTTPGAAGPATGATPGLLGTPSVGTTTGVGPATGTGSNAGTANNSAAPAAVTTTAAPSRTPEAPVPGANSFSEGQARARIEERGFGQVTELRKDDKGIWRARAMKDGRSVNVALDYQGNIVEQ